MFLWKRYLNLLFALTAKRSKVQQLRRGLTNSLKIEQLEDRTVPSTISYTSIGSIYAQNFSTLADPGVAATIVTGTGSPVQGPYDLSSSTGGSFGASGLSGWTGLNIATTIAAEKFGTGEPNTTTGA
jgi:hypothetical protein